MDNSFNRILGEMAADKSVERISFSVKVSKPGRYSDNL
jgi:hypothetical protein